MASTYTARLKMEVMEAGANSGTWGNNTNDNLKVIDASIGGYLSKSVSGSANVTLTTANRDPDVETTNEAGNAIIDMNGTLSGNIYVFLPAIEREYILFNNTSGSYTLQVAPTGHAANNITLTQGAHTIAYVQNGDKVKDLFASSLGNLSVLGNASVTGISTLTGNVAMSANATVGAKLTVTGDIIASANANVTTNVNVTGNISAHTTTSNVNVTGKTLTLDDDQIGFAKVNNTGKNAFGTRTLSSSAPSGGASGDIWYKYS